MPFNRHTESLLRRLVDLLGLVEHHDPAELLSRIQQLQRGLEPEDEFALLLSWLGNCKLVHKLSQEQLPLSSTDTYRVPDLLAVFDYKGKEVPVLIEVKKTHTLDPQSIKEDRLSSLKPHYLKYADVVGLPMLIAWKFRTFWTLFEMRHSEMAVKNYTIGCFRAMEENLLGLLAGDFSYRIAPGTAIQMRIKKITKPDENGAFEGRFEDVHFMNADGTRVPNIPHLASLFLFWENEAEQLDECDTILQRFVIPDNKHDEFASRTLGNLVQAFATLQKTDVNWHAITHDTEHWSHQRGQLRSVVEEGAKHGIFTEVLRIMPRHKPTFL
jgi:hypothetical protein